MEVLLGRWHETLTPVKSMAYGLSMAPTVRGEITSKERRRGETAPSMGSRLSGVRMAVMALP